MPGLQHVVSGLKKAERELEAQLAGVRAAITSLRFGSSATVGATSSRRRHVAKATQSSSSAEGAVAAVEKRPRRKMSAAARAKISAAQKKRWAQAKAKK